MARPPHNPGCAATRGTYTPDCPGCDHTRRQTQQQRNRRTGTHVPAATLASEDVENLAHVLETLEALRSQVAAAAQSAKAKGRPESRLSKQARHDLSKAIDALEALLDGPLLPVSEALEDPPPRRYRKVSRSD